MVSSRKRGRQGMESVEPPVERSMIERIRNMWEFANLAQWIYIFGKAVKIDENLDIEDLEMECMKSHSTVLSDIGLALLKFVSSHRGLTPEIFDEYTRRQYVAKAPQRNPFGTEEEPAKFAEFDAFTKIRVLQQLTQWTMVNPDRIRERMEEQKDSDQTFWRIEPFGWDSEDRTYIVLDDNRLYRQTPPPPPPPPAPMLKKNSKKAKAALRASKRRKISEPAVTDDEAINESIAGDKEAVPEEDDGLGGMKWECLAITLDDLNNFVGSIEKSRDPNEKILRKRIIDDLLPLLEKQEEARKRKAAQKERELLNLEKLATAKRSSRIAGKLEHQRQEEEAREAERKRQAELAMAKKEQEKWMKLEKERESRMMTREQRLKEREARRILHEEELAGLSEDSKKLESGESRLSERHLRAEIERKKQALEELAEEDWVFDCICGAYGQVDDGSHSISCEKCNIWQHTKCVGISEAAANRQDFHFICKTCKRRAEDAEKVKHRPTIKLKVNRPGSFSSPAPLPQLNGIPPNISKPATNGAQSYGFSPQKTNSIHHLSPPRTHYESPYVHPRMPSLPPQSPYTNGSAGSNIVPAPAPKIDGRPTSQGNANSTTLSPHINGFSSRPMFPSGPYPNGEHAFSSLHPYSPTSLPPPLQPRTYSFVNGQSPQSIFEKYSPPAAFQHGVSAGTRPYPGLSPQAAPDNCYGLRTFTPALTGQNGQPQYGSQTLLLPQVGPPKNRDNQINGDQLHGPTSVTFPSPGAPVLTQSPAYRESASVQSPLSDHPPQSTACTQKPEKLPLTQLSSPSAVQPQAPYTNPDPSHDSALPPVISGISPTKHSPPRPPPTAGTAHLASATSSIFPPVTSLTPSPQQPNLTPPVKIAEPERNRLTGQAIAP